MRQRLILYGSFFVFVALPCFGLLHFLFFEYDRQISGYRYVLPSVGLILEILRGPQMHGVLQIFGRGLCVSLVAALYAVTCIFLLSSLGQRAKLRLVAALLSCSFIIPATIKTYTWQSFFGGLWGWNQWGYVLYFATNMSVFFFSAVAAAEWSAGKSFNCALDEYYTGHRNSYEFLRFCQTPLLIGLASTLACTVFAGEEVRRLGTTLRPVSDAFSWGVDEVEVSVIGCCLIVFALALALACRHFLYKALSHLQA